MQNASDELGLPLDRLEVEVISSGSGGILSFFGGKKARIKVRPIVNQHEDEVAKMMEEFSSSDSMNKPGQKNMRKRRSKQADSRKPGNQDVKADVKQNDAHEDADTDGQTEPDEVDQQKASARNRAGQESNNRLEDQEVIQVAQNVLARLLAPLDSDAEVLVNDSDNGIKLEISGGEPGILIGRRGQTLEALQYITTRIVSHQEGRPVKISVDAGGYRKRRRDNMTDLAHKMASKARHTRKPVAVGPLTAQDRRIIHLALRNEGGVSTISRGRGEMKKVIISPRNYS